MNPQRLLLLCLTVYVLTPLAADAEEITFRVHSEALHKIDPRLFGQFMERPSWGGEIGPEGALEPGTHELQPAVVLLLRQMEIPILRFPAGTDADYLDWRDMVSNVPGRGADRPVSTGHKGDTVTNNFGYDEFLRLREGLKSQAILVVNLRDALLKKKPLQEQANLVAGLVAYCNAPIGRKLPEGMPDWPAVRAQNGHPEPYGVKHWQIGNETWFFFKDLRKLAPNDPERRYTDCVMAIAKAMLAVDPSIEFIIDGEGPTLKTADLIRKQLGDKIAYTVFHVYTPWQMRNITREGKNVPVEKATAAEIWNAWVATPDIDDHGLAVIRNPLLAEARKGEFKVAVTEWNWNGRWSLDSKGTPALDSAWAKGVGAAGFVHALMRSGDVIKVGCQSMLVGNVWGIHAIWADREGKSAPYYMPTGMVTTLYSQHHGDRLLAMDSTGVPTYAQPFKMGGLQPWPKVAYLDALATASEHAVFFHVINRHFDQPLTVAVDLTSLSPLARKAWHHMLQGRLNNEPAEGESPQIARCTSEGVPFDGKILKIVLPPRSVSCIEISRSK